MFSTEVSLELNSNSIYIRIEDLLKRSAKDILETSKIPKLPALMLPDHYNNRNIEFSSASYIDVVADRKHIQTMALIMIF